MSLPLNVGAEPLDVLSALWPLHQDLLWLPGWGSDGVSVLAFDPVVTWEAPDLFSVADLRAFRARCNAMSATSNAGTGALAGGIFGGVSYEAALQLDRLRDMRKRTLGFPLARFGFHPVVVAYCVQTKEWSLSGDLQGFAAYGERLRASLLEACGAVPVAKAESRIGSVSDQGRASMEALVSEVDYGVWVRKARSLIAGGDIYQANLSHPLRVRGDEPLPHLFARIHASNPSPWACLWNTPSFALVSNSPELLLSMSDGRMVSKPIAGTRPRGEDDKSDEQHRRNLLRSPKERAEHLMLVDLVRNDMGRVCKGGSVHVPLLMDREPYRNVTHIVSTIHGELDPSHDAVDALAALFPGGTITGTPKLRSMEVIDSLEDFPRGYYTGSLGWMNGRGDLEFNILIRTLQLRETAGGWNGYLHVGAGIVADSKPKREYRETLHKAEAWRRVLEG